MDESTQTISKTKKLLKLKSSRLKRKGKKTLKSSRDEDQEKSHQEKSPIQEYLDTLTDKERKTYEIAMNHLQSSFCIEKSLGFQKWIKQKQK